MSRQTTNYGLTKPDYTDTADIEVVNANMDIIDGALKVIDTKSNNVMSKNSSAWSSTVTYAVGQYCIYNNSLWKSLVQHSGQTPQEGTYWTRVSLDTLDSEINALNSNIGNMQTIVIPRGKKGWYKLFSYQWDTWNYMSMFMIISHNFCIDLAMSVVRTIVQNNISLIDKDATFIRALTNYGSTIQNISIVNDFGAIVEGNKITYYLYVGNVASENYITAYTAAELKSFKINPDVEYIGESINCNIIPSIS